ncbi:MAG: hypothetical protein E6929_11555 [Clostridium sp.]|nr:hypothetical protein [Clostridium sp.]
MTNFVKNKLKDIIIELDKCLDENQSNSEVYFTLGRLSILQELIKYEDEKGLN